MTTIPSVLTGRAVLFAVAVVLSMATWIQAQCGECGDGGCQGRCHYCVDGECVPNRTTYGYYQTNWRRWPVAAPEIPVRAKRGSVSLEEMLGPSDVDLPAPEDETELRPEFSRSRKSGNAHGSPMDSSGFEPFRMDAQPIEPDTIQPEQIVPDVIQDSPLDTSEFELQMETTPFDEGASHGNRLRNPIMQASANVTIRNEPNPLRGSVSTASRTAKPVTKKATKPIAAPRRIRPKVNARPLTTARSKLRPGSGNPLR